MDWLSLQYSMQCIQHGIGGFNHDGVPCAFQYADIGVWQGVL
jgi:hypothetical protein